MVFWSASLLKSSIVHPALRVILLVQIFVRTVNRFTEFTGNFRLGTDISSHDLSLLRVIKRGDALEDDNHCEELESHP